TPTLIVSRNREVLSGVDGGRKQPTATLRAAHRLAHATAASASGAGTDSIPAAGVDGVSPAVASRVTAAAARSRSSARNESPARASRTAARTPATTAGGGAVS